MFLSAIALFVAASAGLSSSAPEPSPRLRRIAEALNGKQQCIPFKWVANDKGTARGAITVPVSVNGRSFQMQLDTGADATSLYGDVAQRQGWATKGSERFRARQVKIAGATVDRPVIFINADMDADADVQGTLGLPALLGNVAVLDYPNQRFCLFAEADVPPAVAEVASVRAMLRNSRLYVPLTIGAVTNDTYVFDTGSSELPLNVDLNTWQALTRRTTTEGAPARYEGSAWGKPLLLPGAPTAEPVSIGATRLGTITVFTNPAQPGGFADWPVSTTGVLGNAPLWEGTVIFDLTAKVRFAVVQ